MVKTTVNSLISARDLFTNKHISKTTTSKYNDVSRKQTRPQLTINAYNREHNYLKIANIILHKHYTYLSQIYDI